MQHPKEISMTLSDSLIFKIEYYPEEELLNLHTNSFEDCGRLWSQLRGQVTDNTEGRKPILYDMPFDPPQLWEMPPGEPELWIMNLEIDKDKIVPLLEHIETELDGFLPAKTTQNFKSRLDNLDKPVVQKELFTSKDSQKPEEEADQVKSQGSSPDKKGGALK